MAQARQIPQMLVDAYLEAAPDSEPDHIMEGLNAIFGESGQLHSYAFDLNSRHSSRRSCSVLLADALPLCFILLVADVLPWRCLGVSNGHTQHCP